MAQERLAHHKRLPIVITPDTRIEEPQPVPFNDSLIVDRVNLNSRKDRDVYPNAGQELLKGEIAVGHVDLDDTATENQIAGALRVWQHFSPGDAFQKNLVVVATDKALKIIEGNKFYIDPNNPSKNYPIIPADLLDDLLYMEGLQKFGVESPIGQQLGGLLLRGLVFDRVVRARILGVLPDWDFNYPKYPKTHSKQPVWGADALARNPKAFFAQMVTPEDYAAGASIFPNQDIEQMGTTERPVGKKVYRAFTKDDLYPTHRWIGRREFFENIPLATGEHTQNLLTILSAIELGGDNEQIIRVFEQAGLQDAHLEPAGDMAKDYTQLLDILGEVLLVQGKQLTDATADDFRAINEKIRQTGNGRLGQILPPLRTMLIKKERIINLQSLAKAERYLYAHHWSAIDTSLFQVKPANQMDPDALNVDMLIELGTTMVQTDPDDQEPEEELGVTVPGAQIWDATTERATHLIESNIVTQNALELRTALRKADLFNPRRYGPDAAEIQHFFRQGEDFIHGRTEITGTPRVVALEVAHKEPTTARPIWEYLRTLFRSDQMIFASNHKATLDSFEGAEGLIVHQNSVLSFIRRDEMKKEGIIPYNARIREDKIGRRIRNTKGDTLKATVLAGIALGTIHPDTILMPIDSDWINVSGPGRYDPVHYIAGLLANQTPDASYLMNVLARIGPERRNQVVLNMINKWTNEGSPLQRRMAENMKRLIWFLSGERAFPAQLLFEHPFPNGYSMEVWLDLIVSISTLLDPDSTFAQVKTPTRKMLTDTLPSKDWAMTNFCANMGDHFMSFWNQLLLERLNRLPENEKDILKDPIAYLQWEKEQKDLLPSAWKAPILARFNKLHGGMPEIVGNPSDYETSPDDWTHAPGQSWENVDYIFARDYLEPSIQEMTDNNWIDWEGLADYLINGAKVPYDSALLENAWWKKRKREQQTILVA